MMYKILILQKMYNISDDQTEYQISGRLSFQRFLGLTLNGKVPDAKTIWNFREGITKAGIIETIFYRFVKMLEERGVITHSGSIADAAFADVPKQRNSRKENETIKEGKTPEEWEKKENRHKKAQKDLDARRAVKNGEKHYGYKDHVKIDKNTKIITKFQTGEAGGHDSRELKNLIEPKKDKKIYGGSACAGEEVQSSIPREVKNRIHEKGYRGRPLTKTQERNSRKKPKIRYGHARNTYSGT
jgi:IS5 family transposase